MLLAHLILFFLLGTYAVALPVSTQVTQDNRDLSEWTSSDPSGIRERASGLWSYQTNHHDVYIILIDARKEYRFIYSSTGLDSSKFPNKFPNRIELEPVPSVADYKIIVNKDSSSLAKEEKQPEKDDELFPELNELMKKYPRDPESRARLQISYAPKQFSFYLQIAYNPGLGKEWEVVNEIFK